MAQKLEEMMNEFRYPSSITTDKNIVTSGSISAGSLATAGIITGANTVPGKFYSSVAVATQATTAAINVIAATVGFGMTLTSATFYSTDDANGTITLAGGGATIATFTKGSNNTVRTATLNTTLVSSSTLTMTNNATSGGYIVLTFTVA